MGEEVPVLMDRAALSGHVRPERGERLLQSRRAVNKDELGCPQATRGKIIQDRPPGRLALAAHVLHRLAYRGKMAKETTPWETEVAGDFAELRKTGISHPLMD